MRAFYQCIRVMGTRRRPRHAGVSWRIDEKEHLFYSSVLTTHQPTRETYRRYSAAVVHSHRRRALPHGNHLTRERRLPAHEPMEQPPGDRCGTGCCPHLTRHGDAEHLHRFDPVAAQPPHELAGGARLAAGGHHRPGRHAVLRGAHPLTPPSQAALSVAAAGEHRNGRETR